LKTSYKWCIPVILVCVLASTFVFGCSRTSKSKEGKVLRIAQAGDIERLDLRVQVGTAKDVVNTMSDWPLLDRPEKVLPNGIIVTDMSGKLIGRIVKEWKTEVLPDGRAKQWFYIRSGIKFHSGNELTAEDLKWYMVCQAQNGRDYLHRSLGGMYGKGELEDKIQIVDKYTMTVITMGPRPFFWDIWAQRSIMDSKLVMQNATKDDPWAEKWAYNQDTGSGPYSLGTWIPGVRMELNKFKNYWSTPPKFDKLIFQVIPSLAGRIMLLKKGEVDVALNIPDRDMNDLAKTPGVKVWSFPSGRQTYIGMNANQAPFNDINLRLALSYAFPYDEVIKGVYANNATPLNGPITAASAIALKERMYNTDLVKAKEYLDKATKGKPLTLTLAYNDELPQLEQLGMLFQQSLKKIGVELKLQVVPRAQYLAQTRDRKLPFVIDEGLAWIQDPIYLIQMWYLSDSYINIIGYKNAKVDELSYKGLSIADKTERDKVSAEAQALIMKDVPWIFIASPDFRIATRDDITGVAYRNTEMTYWWNLDRVAKKTK
jgi:peptide/nickel transport system substrate-binding protein